MNVKPADIDLGDIKADAIILRKAEMLLNFLDKEKWSSASSQAKTDKALRREKTKLEVELQSMAAWCGLQKDHISDDDTLACAAKMKQAILDNFLETHKKILEEYDH